MKPPYKADPAVLEAHKALNDAIKHLEEVIGAKIAGIQVMEDGDTMIIADFETEDHAKLFEIKAGYGAKN